MTSTHREVERKVRVDNSFPDLTSLSLPGLELDHREPFKMVAVYYDTEELTLIRWGITCRRREGGSDQGWHLKLPVSESVDGARDEIRLPLEASDTAVPSVLTNLLTALLRGRTLVPAATVTTVRTPIVVLLEGVEVAEIVDDQVTVQSNAGEAHSFREIEIEALTDDTDIIDDIAEVLIAQGGTASSLSKAASALGPEISRPADVEAPVWPRRKAAAGDAIKAILTHHLLDLLASDVAWRRGDPEGVHDIRVAARRLRSNLKTFRELLDTSWVASIRAELRWLANELGARRDTEVIEQHLVETAAELDEATHSNVLRAIDRHVTSLLADADLVVAEALSSTRYIVLLEQLVVGVRELPLRADAALPTKTLLPYLVADDAHKLLDRADSLVRGGDIEDWHAARIQAKTVRYATESLEPILGSVYGVIAEHCEDVTEILGEHHDCVVALEFLPQVPSEDHDEAFALGRLYEWELDRIAKCEQHFLMIWPSASQAVARLT